ncbi:hypothetical protein OIO90_000864 [Microbotryomycetes sp. JL221]|nr:hypothetical protein OIO90_000864 [Microbotryomycetes sp. JL221]
MDKSVELDDSGASGLNSTTLASEDHVLRNDNEDVHYSIEIVQQPVRARMVGLGDKDRRPISPPVIVKLVARDMHNNVTTADPEELDTSFLIVAADLRTESMDDANLVATSLASKSKAATGPQADSSTTRKRRSSSMQSSASEHTRGVLTASGGAVSTDGSLASPAMMAASLQGQAANTMNVVASGLVRSRSHSQSTTSPAMESDNDEVDSFRPHKKPRSVHTDDNDRKDVVMEHESDSDRSRRARGEPATAALVDQALTDASIPNLIGTLHANAFKLRDERGELGVYFVFSDLSVRTEGHYRLRMRLFPIGHALASASMTSSSSSKSTGSEHRRSNGSAGVAASVTSDVFAVMTAKKFEGMLEPSALSRCFAKQGMRIPTRSSTKRRGKTDNGHNPSKNPG